MQEKSNHYTIIGPDDMAGNLQYWNNQTQEWTPEYDNATFYDRSVLSGLYSIPDGAEAIQEFTPEPNHEAINQYNIIDLPRWEVSYPL